MSESYESSVSAAFFRRARGKARRDFRDLFPDVGLFVRADYKDHLGYFARERLARLATEDKYEDQEIKDRLGYLGRVRPLTSFFGRILRGEESEPLRDLIPNRFLDIASLRFGVRQLARAREGTLGSAYGNLARYSDFAAEAIADIPEGSDLYKRLIEERGFGSSEEASGAFRRESRQARRFLAAEIRQLPFLQEVIERGAVAEAQIDGLRDAAEEFGRVGADGVRSLVTDLTQLDNVAEALVRTFAEMVIQVALLNPVREFLGGVFGTVYGAASGAGLAPAPTGGTVSVTPAGGAGLRGGVNIVNNYQSDVTRRQVVELDAVAVRVSQNQIRRAQSQITSEHYNGRL